MVWSPLSSFHSNIYPYNYSIIANVSTTQQTKLCGAFSSAVPVNGPPLSPSAYEDRPLEKIVDALAKLW